MVLFTSRSLCSACCLLPFVITSFLSPCGSHRHHTCRSPSWNRSSLFLSLYSEPDSWTNSALFLFCLILLGSWMLPEENCSGLNNVASVNVWCPVSSGPAGWLCDFSLHLVNDFRVSSVACRAFLHAWQMRLQP